MPGIVGAAHMVGLAARAALALDISRGAMVQEAMTVALT
jgi:hypothetical protein